MFDFKIIFNNMFNISIITIILTIKDGGVFFYVQTVRHFSFEEWVFNRELFFCMETGAMTSKLWKVSKYK